MPHMLTFLPCVGLGFVSPNNKTCAGITWHDTTLTLHHNAVDTMLCRPGSSSLAGFDKDDLNTTKTYWEPSVAPVGLVSPEMVKLKVTERFLPCVCDSCLT